ncbi:MAG: hypothetical protein KF910_00380 [Brevundimonas sp.]|uniref:hypothetical protein n=1 Tax=Brevundimonas sp. TaxID=1871086 RepID=UPI0025BAD9DE|nr:hypothetical protein [Brevundimonas sp.]MBX3476044.1 hypothetical protein [Brevundimonas sp.]
MSQTYAATPVADDIVDDAFDRPSAALDHAADRILLEDAAAARRQVASVRQAVREDLAQGRHWGRERLVRTRRAIEAEPQRAALYALGAGLLLGLLMRR